MVEDLITHEGNTSEPGRSRARPGGQGHAGPLREGEEPEPRMNGREKSDPAIVATKPANDAGRRVERSPAEELVERRTGAEGNASHRNTHRAQNRASVTQALERVRQAASFAVIYPRW